MDVTDIPSATVHSDSDENRHEKPQTGLHSQYAPEYCNNPLAKREVQTARPCAIIGPDRIIQQQPKRHSVLWPPPLEDTPYYTVPQTYHPYPAEHLYPPRNISPRQTFQENMPRILVPSGSSNKVPSSDLPQHVTAPSSILEEGNIYIPKHFNPNLPLTKYCNVPYQVNEHRPHTTKIGDIYVTKCDTLSSALPPMPPHPNVSTRTWQQVPVPQYPGTYPASSLNRYADYQPCPPPMYRPVKQGNKKTNDETPPTYIGEGIYRNSDYRYQPYPTVKDKYGQARYDYSYNISNQFLPNFNTSQRSDYPKTVMRQPVHYPQLPHKYLENRSVETSADCLHKVAASRHPPQTTNHSVPYQTNENISVKHIPGEHMYPVQSKVYGYSGDNSGRYINSVKSFENSKIYLDYNQRVKNIAYGDSSFVSDPTLASYHKTQAPIYNYPMVNSNGQRGHPPFNVNYKMFENLGNVRHLPEYNIPYKTQDLRHHTYNPLARIPAQFSPNIISPTDSNTSVESTQQLTQEDGGYVSQCSTTSGKSVEYPHKFYSNCDRKGMKVMDNKLFVPPAFYNMSHTSKPAPEYTHQNLYHMNHTLIEQNKQSKQGPDVRQFLQMWNPHEEFGEASPSQELTNCDKLKDDNSVSGNVIAGTSGQNQLYVLGLVNVSSEELPKYGHIQKVNRLPDNIKGYTNMLPDNIKGYSNLELLNQFEEALGKDNQNESRDTYGVSKIPIISGETDNIGIGVITNNTSNYDCARPISPLDVEAKISQSIIHKEVGCNFEIKPCSPVKNPNLPIISNVPKLEHSTVSDIFHNTNQPVDTTPDESTQVSMDIKSKRRAKIGNTHAASKRPKITSLQVFLNPYKSNDSDQVPPECQSSLPQLDSDIDMIGNATTQNKNDAMIDCSRATYLESNMHIPYMDAQFSPNSLIHTNMEQKDIISSNDTVKLPLEHITNDSPISSPINLQKNDEKNLSKLSKYRKVKKIDSPFSEMSMASSNTNEYSSNSPLNLELALEQKGNKNRCNEAAVLKKSGMPQMHGLVNSVINSITDGKIKSVIYSDTYDSMDHNLGVKHISIKKNDSLQSSYGESPDHCGSSVESSIPQKNSEINKKLSSYAEEFDNLKVMSSNIQDFDEKSNDIQLKDNDNLVSDNSTSNASKEIDVFKNTFNGANLAVQSDHESDFIETDRFINVSPLITTINKDEIECESDKNMDEVTNRINESTPGEIKNITFRNNVIQNGFTNKVNENHKKIGDTVKTNCEVSLTEDYKFNKLSPESTELTTRIDEPTNLEMSRYEERVSNISIEKNNDTIDKTIISEEIHHEVKESKCSTNTSTKLLTSEIDHRSECTNIFDSQCKNQPGNIENHMLMQVIGTEKKSACVNDTFSPKLITPTNLINSPDHERLSHSKDSPKNDKYIEKTIISDPIHYGVLSSIKNVTDTGENLVGPASKCEHIVHSENLNVLKDIKNHTQMEIADIEGNYLHAADDIISLKSTTLTTLESSPASKCLIDSEEHNSEVTDDNLDKDQTVEKTTTSDEIQNTNVVLLKSSTGEIESTLSTESELKSIKHSHLNVSECKKIIDSENSNISQEIEKHTLIGVANKEINSIYVAHDISPKATAQTTLRASLSSQGISCFEEDNLRDVEKTQISDESQNGIVVSLKRTTDRSENLLSTEPKLKNIKHSHINVSEHNDIVDSEDSNVPKEIENQMLIEVSDLEIKSLHEADNILSPKSTTQSTLHSEVTKCNPNQHVEKTIISDKVQNGIEILKSMTDTSENLLSRESEFKNILHSDVDTENLNISKDIENHTVIEVAVNKINSSHASDNILSSKSIPLTTLIGSPADQAISYSEEHNSEIPNVDTNNDEHVVKTTISDETQNGIVVLLKSTTDTSETLSSTESKLKNIKHSQINVSECKNIEDSEYSNVSKEIKNQIPMEVSDLKIKSLHSADKILSPKSTSQSTLKGSPVKQGISYFKEPYLEVPKYNPNKDQHVEKTTISDEVQNGIEILKSMTDTSENLLSAESEFKNIQSDINVSECKNVVHSENLNLSKDIENNKLMEVANIIINCSHASDNMLSSKSTALTTLVASPVNQAISYSAEHNSEVLKVNLNNDQHVVKTTIPDEFQNRIVVTKLKSTLDIGINDTSKKILSRESECTSISNSDNKNVSEIITNNILLHVGTEINYIREIDKSCLESHPKTPLRQDCNDKHFGNILSCNPTKNDENNICSATIEVVSNENPYLIDDTRTSQNTASQPLAMEGSEDTLKDSNISMKITNIVLDSKAELASKPTDFAIVTETPKTYNNDKVCGGLANKTKSTNDSSVSEKLYLITNEHSSKYTNVSSIKNYSCKIIPPTLKDTHDYPMSEDLNLETNESILCQNDMSKLSVEDNDDSSVLKNFKPNYGKMENNPVIGNFTSNNYNCAKKQPNLLENDVSPIVKQLNYENDINISVGVEVTLKKSTMENTNDIIAKEINDEIGRTNIDEVSTYAKNNKKSGPHYSPISREFNDEKDVSRRSVPLEENIGCYHNGENLKPVLVDNCKSLKSKELDYERSEDISVATTLNNKCSKSQPVVYEKANSTISNKLNDDEYENGYVQSKECHFKNGENNCIRKKSITNETDILVPMLVKNYGSPISEGLNYEKDNFEKKIKFEKEEHIYVGINITSKDFNNTDKLISEKGKQFCSSILKGENESVEGKMTSKDSIKKCDTSIPVSVENYDSLMSKELNCGKEENFSITIASKNTNVKNIDDSKAGNVKQCNSLIFKELKYEKDENKSVGENVTSKAKSENIKCDFSVPVLFENYHNTEPTSTVKYNYSPISENQNIENHSNDSVSLKKLNYEKGQNIGVEEKNTLDASIKQNCEVQVPVLGENCSQRISTESNFISEKSGQNNTFTITEAVCGENDVSPMSNYEEDENKSVGPSNIVAAKETIENNNNCEIKEKLCDSPNFESVEIIHHSTTLSDKMTSIEGINNNAVSENALKSTLVIKKPTVSTSPTDEEKMNYGVNVDEVNNEIEQIEIQEDNSLAQFSFEKNKFDIKETENHIVSIESFPSVCVKSDSQYLDASKEGIEVKKNILQEPCDSSLFLSNDSEDFMHAGVITVKDKQHCVVLERNGEIYSERGNSIEDLLCNMVPCSPLSDTDDAQDYELVSGYDNIPNDGVTDSIDNFSGVDILISSSEGDENANNIIHTHKDTLFQEAPTCESDSEESSHCNVDSRDPCLQGLDDSPALLEIQTDMSKNNFCESSNFDDTHIGIQYEDCWINDVACIETVISEDVSDITPDESVKYDECDNGSKKQDSELHLIDCKENISIADVKKESKSLYVRIKLVSQNENENVDRMNSCSINDLEANQAAPLIEIDKISCVEIPTQSSDKRKSLKVPKYDRSSSLKVYSADMNMKNDNRVSNCKHFEAKSAHTAAARGRVVSNVPYNYNTDTTHGGTKLITKAAQKYIPPIVDSQHNFKVQLPLSKDNLLRLKIMKVKFEEATPKPKMRWQVSLSQAASTSYMKTSTNDKIPKKVNPKFDDVLKKIDYMQINSLSKPKRRKDESSVPKVIIKKNEHGSHYTANVKHRRAKSPDLTGRRWQPWVYLERNRLIEKMISKNRCCAVFCPSSKKYIISRKEHRDSRGTRREPEIVISNPLKCTIKLHTDSGLGHTMLRPAHVSTHTSHSSLHHSKPILTISNYKKNK